MTGVAAPYANNAHAALRQLMHNAFRDGPAAFGSITDVRDTLKSFDQSIQAMQMVLRYVEERVKTDFEEGHAHQDLSAAAVEQFGIQREKAVQGMTSAIAALAWMGSTLTFFPSPE